MRPGSALLPYRPSPREPVDIAGAGPLAPAGAELDLVAWNIQFGAGRAREFFYDGGAAVGVPVRDLRACLDGVARHLEGADVALLQEVDRGSDRTGRVDELAALPFAVAASAPCHRAFVPYPPGQWLGRVHMHQCIVSRWALVAGERVALPEMADAWYRRPFNLRRCIVSARLPVAGGRELWLASVHLSAFTGDDDSLRRQCEAVATWIGERERAGDAFVLAGDFNCGPPGTVARHAGRPEPWEPLRGLRRVETGPTYQAYGEGPTQALDHVFVSRDLAVVGAEVHPTEWSDHLPIRVRVRLPA